jgi:hypothetical protein
VLVLDRITQSSLMILRRAGKHDDERPTNKSRDPITIVSEFKSALTRLATSRYGGTPQAEFMIQAWLTDLRAELVILKEGEPTTTTLASFTADSAATHEPLEEGDDIRLLYLLPTSNSEDPIKCMIKRTAFKTSPGYEALSYTWGLQQGDSGSLDVTNYNKSKVTITRNLDSALRDLREGIKSNDGHRVLWVDAVCIDQNNLEES